MEMGCSMTLSVLYLSISIDKDGGYHFSGILATSHCGTTMERLMGFKRYEFTVSKEVFDKSFTVSRMYFWYTCENGVPTNFTF